MDTTFTTFANYSRLATMLHSLGDGTNAVEVEDFANKLVTTIQSKKRLILFGNGGSAAEASHFAAELISKCSTDHNPWPAISLAESPAVLTAIGNDYGFDQIFSRQLEAHLQDGDLVLGLSTSGKSPNVMRAINFSLDRGNPTFLMTGLNFNQSTNSKLKVVRAPATDTPRIQEIHLVWIHLLSEYCEKLLS